jgi:hypothetical protein
MFLDFWLFGHKKLAPPKKPFSTSPYNQATASLPNNSPMTKCAPKLNEAHQSSMRRTKAQFAVLGIALERKDSGIFDTALCNFFKLLRAICNVVTPCTPITQRSTAIAVA